MSYGYAWCDIGLYCKALSPGCKVLLHKSVIVCGVEHHASTMVDYVCITVVCRLACTLHLRGPYSADLFWVGGG